MNNNNHDYCRVLLHATETITLLRRHERVKKWIYYTCAAGTYNIKWLTAVLCLRGAYVHIIITAIIGRKIIGAGALPRILHVVYYHNVRVMYMYVHMATNQRVIVYTLSSHAMIQKNTVLIDWHYLITV